MTIPDPLSLWLLFGLILLICEMLTMGFYLLFIAVGCFAAALAASLGAHLWGQSAVCALVAITGTLTLRKPIQSRLLKSMGVRADVGKEIRVDAVIDPHQQNRISYQGSTWLATNLGIEKINKGDHVTIVGIDGNILLVRKNNI